MRIGVAFPTTEVGTDPAVIRDFAQAVEEMGYDHITCIDHVLQEPPHEGGEPWQQYYTLQNMFHEPLILYGFLAACTTKIELATAILILPQRQTVLVAKQIAELDILTQGRIRLGCGVGWNELEFNALGANFKDRGKRSEEQVALMRALWSQEVVTFDGEWHQIKECGINPLPVQKPVPVWLGAFAPPAIKRAGRIADGWFANPFFGAFDEETPRDLDIFRGAVRDAGRDPEKVGIDGTLQVGDRGPQEWAAEAEEWKRHGVSHVTFRTMKADYGDLDNHLEAMRKFREVYPNK